MTDYKFYFNRSAQRNTERRGYVAVALMVVALAVAGAMEQEPEEATIVRPVAKSKTEERIESVVPAAVAHVICDAAMNQSDDVMPQRKQAMTLAAIAHRETVRGGYDHHAIGDGGKSKGLFQIQQRLHGAVPDDLEGQVAQATDLFLDYARRYGYRAAVKRWNGDGPLAQGYQRHVLAMVREMER